MSFALTWFRGYDDFPHVQPVFVFARNVDPATGRPRRAGSQGRCDPDGLVGPADTSGCLGDFDGTTPEFSLQNPVQVEDLLTQHPANQQLFHTVCASTLGFTDLLPEGCSLNVWNSTEPSLPPTDPLFPLAPRLSMAFSAMLAGGTGNALLNGKTVLFTLGEFAEQGSTVITDPSQLPLVPLVAEPGDGPSVSTADLAAAGLPPDPVWTDLWGPGGLALVLSQAQEALLGCGSSEGPAPAESYTQRSFFGTHCDIHGFDAFNTEGSALLQSWPGPVDRLTFVRFLNRSRSFFMNLQVFLQYVAEYRKSFPRDGPLNTLATFTVATGYHQDRLIPTLTWVHDLPSHSGAVLFGVGYRY